MNIPGRDFQDILCVQNAGPDRRGIFTGKDFEQPSIPTQEVKENASCHLCPKCMRDTR